MAEIKVAALQMKCTSDVFENIKKAEELVRTASEAGA